MIYNQYTLLRFLLAQTVPHNKNEKKGAEISCHELDPMERAGFVRPPSSSQAPIPLQLRCWRSWWLWPTTSRTCWYLEPLPLVFQRVRRHSHLSPGCSLTWLCNSVEHQEPERKERGERERERERGERERGKERGERERGKREWKNTLKLVYSGTPHKVTLK